MESCVPCLICNLRSYGAPNPNSSKYRDKRYAVLEKLSRLGQGLSNPQRVDFPWFKESWDRVMLESHGDQWGYLFAMQVQQILDNITAGTTNAFSVMMHKETVRLLHTPAIRI